MKIFDSSNALGAIVCKNCGKLIDTIDAEKVETHYSDCKSEQCINQGTQKE
jgi:hypothetical protein